MAEIEKNYRNGFKGGVELAYQQLQSQFRSLVDVTNQDGEFDFYDRIGIADDMVEDNTTASTNVDMGISHDRRRIATRPFKWGKYIDEKLIAPVATDPSNAYTQAAKGAANRRIDDLIITGLTGTAYIGKSGETSVSFVGTTSGKITVGAISNQAGNIVAGTYAALTSGNYEGIDVAKDFTGAAAADAGLTLAKLKALKETMLGTMAVDQKDFPLINMFIGRRQWSNLLGITEIVNSDYAMKQRLESLSVTEWGGFRFVLSERLTVASGVRSCLAFIPRSFKLAFRKDVTADMWRDSHRDNTPYLSVKMDLGGTRMYGESTARVQCVE